MDRQGHDEFASAAWPRADSSDRAAMELHDLSSDREAHAQPLGGRFTLGEWLEQMGKEIRWNTAACVADSQDRLPCAACEAHRHSSAWIGIANPIDEKIRHYFLKSRGVGVDPHRLFWHLRVETLAPALRLQRDGIHELSDQATQIESLKLKSHQPQAKSAPFEQIVEKPSQPHELTVEDDTRALTASVVWSISNNLERSARCGKRLPRLVGNASQDLSRRQLD
jgi:hypothetical protein